MAIDETNSEVVAQNANQAQRNFEEEQKLNFEKLRKKTEALEAKLHESEQLKANYLQAIEQLQAKIQPQTKDEFESLPEDELIDKAKLRRILEKERQYVKEEAIKSARQAYEAIEKENYASKLKTTYPDYEDVVNEQNAQRLQDEDPEFMSALAKIDDDFARRDLAYKKMKKIAQAHFSKMRAQETVNENQKISASYMNQSGQSPAGNPNNFDFNVRDAEARTKAYKRLRDAQKRGF